MEHIEVAVQNVINFIGAFGLVVSILVAGVEYTTLAATLAGLTALFAVICMYFIHRLSTGIGTRLDELETKVDSGFEESLEAIDDADETNYHRTDGGEWRDVRNLDVEKMNFSGIPSVAGAGALGAFGALFGPAGAAAGATLGALIGGGKEFQDLKDEHRQRLQNAAWVAVKRETSVPGHLLTLEDVDDKTAPTNDYWVFQFDEQGGGAHLVRISKNDGSVQYRPAREQ